MSALQGKVGSWELSFKSIPRGSSGTVQVQVDGKLVEVSWRRDADGIWIELPHGVYGFDLKGENNDEGGIEYQVSARNGAKSWSKLSFKRSGEESAAQGAAASAAKKGVRVRAQMPGKITRVLVAAGATVEKNQPLFVMEAMKMENEIRAPQAGIVGQLKVSEGQAVETGAHLCVLDAV